MSSSVSYILPQFAMCNLCALCALALWRSDSARPDPSITVTVLILQLARQADGDGRLGCSCLHVYLSMYLEYEAPYTAAHMHTCVPVHAYNCQLSMV